MGRYTYFGWAAAWLSVAGRQDIAEHFTAAERDPGRNLATAMSLLAEIPGVDTDRDETHSGSNPADPETFMLRAVWSTQLLPSRTVGYADPEPPSIGEAQWRRIVTGIQAAVEVAVDDGARTVWQQSPVAAGWPVGDWRAMPDHDPIPADVQESILAVTRPYAQLRHLIRAAAGDHRDPDVSRRPGPMRTDQRPIASFGPM